jgi:DNA-directed RNA polymerase subunit L
MNPTISKIAENDAILTFTLSGVNVSIANGLRRIISEIPTVVFRTSPYEANRATFEMNTTRMNNELIKQRLSCIPIYTDSDFPTDTYMVVVDKQNKSNTIEYCTTEDFEVINVETGKKDPEMTRRLFPPNSLTGDYTELVRLLPRVSDNIEGERIAFKAKFDLGTAKEDSAFNVASSWVYSNTPDMMGIKNAWAKKKAELDKSLTAADIAFIEKDWHLLEAKRYFLPDAFDFMIETVGPFTNMAIVNKAAQLMLRKLRKLQDTIQNDPTIIVAASTTIPNCFDIILKNEDYTLGKVIECLLYMKYYEPPAMSPNKAPLHYCGFRKPHPHIDESLIRLGFKEPTDKVGVITYMMDAATEAIRIYDYIVKTFEIVA